MEYGVAYYLSRWFTVVHNGDDSQLQRSYDTEEEAKQNLHDDVIEYIDNKIYDAKDKINYFTMQRQLVIEASNQPESKE
jgi:hypothetical protein